MFSSTLMTARQVDVVLGTPVGTRKIRGVELSRTADRRGRVATLDFQSDAVDSDVGTAELRIRMLVATPDPIGKGGRLVPVAPGIGMLTHAGCAHGREQQERTAKSRLAAVLGIGHAHGRRQR